MSSTPASHPTAKNPKVHPANVHAKVRVGFDNRSAKSHAIRHSTRDPSMGAAERHVAAIDMVSVRDLVEELLKGGHDAFEQRRPMYG